MKITFLGTGAADWPLQKPDGYMEFRRLSSALIDDVLLIDPGPQVIYALEDLGKSPAKIKYIINTHSHRDHFSQETLSHLESLGATFILLSDGEVKTVGQYTIRAYKGNHDTCKNTVHFIITDGERTLFYGLDGAWLTYEEYEAIQRQKVDLGVFDATIGFVDGDIRIFEHNNLNMVIEMKKTLSENIERFFISHMAYTLHDEHEILSANMKNYGIDVAFDGMTIEF